MRHLTSFFQPKVKRQNPLSVQDEHFSIPDGFPSHIPAPPLSLSSSSQEACHFFRLPYEIREQIYLLAFGDQVIIHMDLQHRHAYYPGGGHANIMWNASAEGDRFDYKTSKQWRWGSSVCHRPKNRHGACCKHGYGTCCDIDNGRPPRDPSACFIGVNGWLRSCKKAYTEILPILYSTNTLYISSMPLLQRLTSALSPTALSLVTSLHLNLELWPEDCPNEFQGLQPVNRIKRFSMYSRILSQFAPIKFPALKKLSIEFTSDWHSDGWDLFTQSVAKTIPGKPGGIYLLEPTDKIVDSFNGKLALQLILKPEHAFVISHKLRLFDSVIRGTHPFTNSQYWKIWRDLHASSEAEEAGWPGQGYWIHWDPYFQLPIGVDRETAGPYADKWWHVHSSQPWSFWTDGNGFVYRRPVAELKLDRGLEADGVNGPWGLDAAAREREERDRRVWYSEEEVEWSPLSWLRERAA